MPIVSRLNDMTAGHGYHPTNINSASGDVIAGGQPVARVGDTCVSHDKPDSPPHTPVIAGGSGSVIANGKPLVRLGDPCNCGDSIATGVDSVIAGG